MGSTSIHAQGGRNKPQRKKHTKKSDFIFFCAFEGWGVKMKEKKCLSGSGPSKEDAAQNQVQFPSDWKM